MTRMGVQIWMLIGALILLVLLSLLAMLFWAGGCPICSPLAWSTARSTLQPSSG